MEVTHYFNYTPALIPEYEEEVFYRHPTFPVETNQLGALFPDEGYTITTWKDHGKIRVHCVATNLPIVNTSKSRMVLECYTGRRLSPTKAQHVFLDGNEDNYSLNNLFLKGDLTPQQIAQSVHNRLLFREHSINYLKALEEKIRNKGLDLEKYLGFLKLPSWLLDRTLVKTKSQGTMHVSTKLPNAKNHEKMMRVIELRNMGYTRVQIQKEMGFINDSSIKYWIMKYNAIHSEDI